MTLIQRQANEYIIRISSFTHTFLTQFKKRFSVFLHHVLYGLAYLVQFA